MKKENQSKMLQRMLSLLVVRAPMLGRLKPALRALLRRPQAERELDEELRHHIEQQTEQNIRLGMNPEEASYAALRAFGGVEQAKELSRDARGVRWLEDLWQDLRYEARMLWKNPGFTLVAVITLALGIGANTAIFSLVEALLLRPLPYAEPDRLALLSDRGRGGERNNIPYPNFSDWRDRAQSFEGMASIRNQTLNLTGVDKPVSLRGRTVNWNFFHLLGVQPQLGRLFVAEDDRRGAARTALLSDGLWKAQFGGDPSVIGRKLMLDGESYEAIGVLPPGFEYFQADDVYVPIGPFLKPDGLMLRGVTMGLYALGRLRPGVTLAQANSELAGIAAQLEREYPADNKDRGTATAEPLQDVMSEGVRRSLWILLSSVGFILLIACINVANLLLVRAMARRKELTVRAALGAGRARIIRQLLTETAILSLLGGVIGLLLAWGGVRWLVALEPDWIPRVSELGINGTVLGFTILISILTGVIAGLLPALLASQTDLNEGLKEGLVAKFSTRRGWWRASPKLVVVELALSMVLLIGAGLMIKSFVRLMGVEKGFQPENVLTMKIRLSDSKYPRGSPQLLAYCRESLARLQTLPGVQSAALTTWLPLTGLTGKGALNIEGRPPWEGGKSPVVEISTVSPDYFRTLGMQMRAGRAFNDGDRADAPSVVIINETLARLFFPGEDPLGKRLDSFNPKSPWAAIVGVVADVKHLGLDEEVRPEIYFPYSQARVYVDPILVVRTAIEPDRLAVALRHEVAVGDPDQPVYEVMTMEQRLANSMAVRRNGMLLFGVFAAIALIIAAIGIYGVISYSVGQRTREIGVRMALGAERRDVLKLVLKQGLKLISAGVTIGLIASLALTRLMRNLLFEVSATDPPTFVVIALILIIAAVLACWVPARRATKVDPVVALRKD
jgi:predicted permease